MLVRCREPGNPLRNEFAHFFARNGAAFVGGFDAALDSGRGLNIDFNLVLSRFKQVRFHFSHALTVADSEPDAKPKRLEHFTQPRKIPKTHSAKIQQINLGFPGHRAYRATRG